MTLLTNDESGVVSAVEFLLTFSIAAIIFGILVLSINGLFLDQSRAVVGTNQFTDVGNDISTRIIETYLLAPDSGNVTSCRILTYFEVPPSIEGSGYTININKHEKDERVNIVSTDNLISVTSTLNGAGETIPIDGSTSSMSLLHYIDYQRGPQEV
ncbi:MAG TPA: hypothetical protein VGJ92_13055 [Methanocella sp.]|jgi:hypothetical protein